MVTPLVRFLYQSGHAESMDVLVRPGSADALAGHPLIREVICLSPSASLRQQWELIRDLRSRNYAEAWVLHRSFHAALIMAFAGIPLRIGYATEGRSFLLTHSYPYHPQAHRAENHLMLASDYLRRPFYAIPLEYHLPAEVRRSAFLPDQPYFVVNPNASWDTKRWLPERFAEVARRIRTRTNWLPVFIGSSTDRPLVSQVATETGEPYLNLAGQTGWKDLALLLQGARLVITNDSGPMHLAVALKTPTVALFGPTSPHRTGPYPRDSALVLRHIVPCSPCYLKKCPPKNEFQCMRGLTSEMVVSSALAYVARHQEVVPS